MFNDDILNEYYKLYIQHISVNNKQEQIKKTKNILTQHGDITIDWKTNAEKVGKIVNRYRIKLFEMIINELNINNIPYFLSDGSALGCYRNGKIIPHDVDIDITISEKHLYNVIHILKKNLCKKQLDDYNINSNNIIIQTIDRYSKIDWNENTPNFIDICDNYENVAKKICIKYTDHLTDIKNHEIIPDLFAIAIDIYTYRTNNTTLNINYKHRDINITSIDFPITSIFPLKQGRFENIDVTIVANSCDYLKRAYGYIGPDCFWDKNTQRFCKL